jgi:Flp pilus assembly protein TadD
MASASDASQLLREGQSHSFAEPPDYAAAEKAYRAATNLSPEWGEPYHWLGFVLQRQGNLEEATDAYQRAIHLLASDPRPINALGGLQRLRGQYDEAIKSLERGLALRPHYAEADARLMLAEAFARVPITLRKLSLNGAS